MIDDIIYLLLTVLIPLKQTYDALKFKYQEGLKLWSVYWGIFFTLKSIQWNVKYLQSIPFDFVFILICMWTYTGYYKGGLFLSQTVRSMIQKTPIRTFFQTSEKDKKNI